MAEHEIIRTVTYRGCVIPEPYNEYEEDLATYAAGFDAGYEAGQLNRDAPTRQDLPLFVAYSDDEPPIVGPAGYPSIYRDASGELWQGCKDGGWHGCMDSCESWGALGKEQFPMWRVTP